MNNENDFYEQKFFIADPGQEPLRVDKFLLDRMAQTSRNKIQNAIKAGAVTIGGKPIKANRKVKPNEKVDIVIPRPFDQAVRVEPDDIPLDIRYEDDDVIVLHKQPGLVVHPGFGNYRRTLVNGLMHYYGQKDLPVMEGNPTNRPGLVHRIDKNTSGLMVIAKTDFAMAHLAKQFYNHTAHRRYQAIVWGQPEEESGYLEKNVGRHPRFRKMMTVFDDASEGKRAATHWKVVDPLYYVSLIECRLETGRTHQIRIHMKHLGHPLFNDEIYGGDKIRKGTVYSKYKQFVHNAFKICPRQALHAKELGFVHPTTGEEMLFDSELPDDMKNVLEKWRHYVENRMLNKSTGL